MLNPDTCYQALLTRDRRFDGLFFIAVKTTKIYCRPVCTVKPPQQKNVNFYETAAACEGEGYRPCLKCRPELAPGNAPIDAGKRLIAQAISLIQENYYAADSIEELSEELGVSSRHLRRVFEIHVGVSPIQFIQTQRLLMAKRLLTDTKMAISDLALASGFSSIRRFNHLFLERYRLSPTELRKSSESKIKSEDKLVCQLPFVPPYNWNAILSYLKGRSCAGVEHVSDSSYMRTVAVDSHLGYLSVELDEAKSSLIASLSLSLAPKILPIIARLRRVFDLDARTQIIEEHLGSLAEGHCGLRIAGAFDPFEISIRAILGQQVSVKAASSLFTRLASRFGQRIQTPFEELNLLFPDAKTLAKAQIEDLSALGIMPARAKTITAFASAYARGELKLLAGADYEKTVLQLTSMNGIGEWTADYIAMRCLAYPDAFPHNDLGIKKFLNAEKKGEMLALAEKYRPWRSYAAMHMWKSLENACEPTIKNHQSKGVKNARSQKKYEKQSR